MKQSGVSLAGIILLLLCCMLCFGVSLSVISAETGTATDSSGEYVYEIQEDDTVIITDYLGNTADLAVPETLDGHTVAGIGAYAFSGRAFLTSVQIPPTVQTIADGAFETCSSLISVTLPESITEIGYSAFSECSSLPSIILPQGLTEISENVFANCSSLTSVTLPDGMTRIGWNAFSGCSSLPSIILPQGLTEIAWGAFEGCTRLTDVTIPASLTDIQNGIFTGCTALQAFHVNAGNTKYRDIDGVLISADRGTLMFCPFGKAGKYTVPNGIHTIAYEAFADCEQLTDVIFSESVTYVEYEAFRHCTALQTVTLSDGLFTYDTCFTDCPALTTVILPASVTRVYPENLNRAFGDCPAFTTVRADANNPAYRDVDGVLFSKNAKTLVWFPCGKTSEVTVAASVLNIGPGAFAHCKHLTAVHLPEGIAKIGSDAFTDCSSLKALILPPTVTGIGYGAFSRCENLSEITLPESITEIDSSVLANCGKLKTVYVHQNSYAQNYAAENGLPVTPLTEYKDTATGSVVKANEPGALPSGAVLRVSAISQTPTGITYSVSLTSSGKNIEPAGSVTVQLPVPDKFADLAVDIFYNNIKQAHTVQFPGSVRLLSGRLGTFALKAGENAYNGLFLNNHIQPRSRAEIAQYIKNHPTDTATVIYDKAPEYSGGKYSPGKLNAAFLRDGLNALNIYRYIAGLDEVTLNEAYNELAQAASMLCAANNMLAHVQDKPADMPESLYQQGSAGCSSSNLAGAGWGELSLAYSVDLYMDDSDDSNIDVVGHRRWCLNPDMKETGMGSAGGFAALYAFDSGYDADADAYRVAWPAANTPSDLFYTGQAWSFSKDTPFSENTTVTLTRLSDNATWRFGKSGSNGDFFIDNGGYGQSGCVIFRPGNAGSSFDGQTFRVTVKDGLFCADYTVNFFSSLGENANRKAASEHTWGQDAMIIESSDFYSSGQSVRTCPVCGDTHTEWLPSGEEKWKNANVSELLPIFRAVAGEQALPVSVRSIDTDWNDIVDLTDVLVLYTLISGN